jgi:RimJ/RimL family protein N-acetyltransferase
VPQPSPPLDVPTLTDGTVTVRGFVEGDVQGCWEQCVDPLSIRWTQVPVPYSHHDAREFCLDYAPAAWADGSQWILVVERDGRYCGNIALRDEGHGRAEIAYGAHPAARGTGAMEAGLRLMLEWGFGTVGVRTVVWRAEVGNWGSRHLAWRLGFTMDGVLRRSHVSRGELVDAWVGTLLSGEPREPAGRWLRPVPLEGDGVRLRPFDLDDVPRIVEACGDQRTHHWLGRMPSPYTEDDALRWLHGNQEQMATGRGVTWAVADPSSGRMLASINLFDLDETEAEVGYWAHPDARGRGVMTEAVRVVTDWAFAELGLRIVRGAAAVENAASRRVFEANGFRLGGEERLATTLDTGRADIAFYDVTAEEWAAGR